MLNGWLEGRDVEALAAQAVDLLDPEGTLTVSVRAQPALVGDQGGFSLTHGHRVYDVDVAGAESDAVLRVDAGWTPADALANLIAGLSALCGNRFRGSWFPPCPGHEHCGEVDVDGDVTISCPDSGRITRRLVPRLASR